jgi:hypothetical protein
MFQLNEGSFFEKYPAGSLTAFLRVADDAMGSRRTIPLRGTRVEIPQVSPAFRRVAGTYHGGKHADDFFNRVHELGISRRLSQISNLQPHIAAYPNAFTKEFMCHEYSH